MRGRTFPAAVSSVIFLQVHAGVKTCYLVSIAIEHESWTLAELANAALAGLAPAWMILLRIHVGVKAVFVRRHSVPCGRRHGVSKADLHDRFDALESVLPRHHQAQRSAVNVGKNFVIKADSHDGQRMHGFIET